MKSRAKAILICGLLLMAFAALCRSYGCERTWQLWHIPTMTPHFADLRTITHGAESHALGLDPMLENPADPWQRRLDYPRVWQGLYRLGVGPSHTTLLGGLLILMLLGGVCLILPDADDLVLAAVFLALLSPAVLFGVERGNIDLLMFFLAAVAAVAVRRSAAAAAAVLAAGFVLKLFPMFGAVVLVRAGRTRFRRLALILAAVAVAYVLATASDLVLMREASLRGTTMCYGLDVLGLKLGAVSAAAGRWARILSYVAVVVIGVTASLAALRPGRPWAERDEGLPLDAFRIGAAIYLGTFLFDVNWDYRLVFLILAVPRLVAWTVSRGGTVAAWTLAAAYLSLWYPLAGTLLGRLPHGGLVRLVLEDVATWAVFAGLLYLLLRSAPDWVKQDARQGPIPSRRTEPRP